MLKPKNFGQIRPETKQQVLVIDELTKQAKFIEIEHEKNQYQHYAEKNGSSHVTLIAADSANLREDRSNCTEKFKLVI